MQYIWKTYWGNLSLFQEVFEYFIDRDQQMKLTCWYLQKYYKDNPLPQYTEKIIQS